MLTVTMVGPKRRCEVGFTLSRYKCTDVDECTVFRGICQGNVHCTNTVGSYVCGCRHGYETSESSCIDVNECQNSGICPENSNCKNVAGNYTCQCRIGYEGALCTDIDECIATGSCHSNATCNNIEGGYNRSCELGFHGDGQTCVSGQCDDRSCSLNAECVSPTTDECTCKKGFEYNMDVCEDVNECLLGHDCDENSLCTNLQGNYNCACVSGYFGDGKTCQEGSCAEDMCPVNEECVSPTTIECRCRDGFERNVSSICVDTDECSEKESCDQSANCINTIGSYNCTCDTGYFGDGFECFDSHECDTGVHNCHKKAKCINTLGSFYCECKTGFHGNGTTCSDDECATGDHTCHTNATCQNTKKNFNCKCKTGFFGNGTTCTDLDECNTNLHSCGNFAYDANCTNTEGSFSCSCDAGVGEVCEAKWILVLSTSENKRSVMLDGMGRSKQVRFKIGDRTEVKGSCSIMWRGKMFVFGGWSKYYRQISVVDQCELKSVGQLEFRMQAGACAQRNDTEIFICFEDTEDENTYKNCHRSVGPLSNFTKLPNSAYRHGNTRIATTADFLMACGGTDEPYGYPTRKMELLSRSNTWSTEKLYPFGAIELYAIVSLESTFYIFGGDGSSAKTAGTRTIAAFSTITKEWNKVGKMNKNRHGHGVFAQDGVFLVVGGYKFESVEQCKLDGDSITCKLFDPKLEDFSYYPEMMQVPFDYCS